MGVILIGVELPAVSDAPAFSRAVAGWYHDPDDRRGIVHIKLARRPVRERLTVTLRIDPSLEIAASPPYPEPEITPDIDKTRIVATASSAREPT